MSKYKIKRFSWIGNFLGKNKERIDFYDSSKTPKEKLDYLLKYHPDKVSPIHINFLEAFHKLDKFYPKTEDTFKMRVCDDAEIWFVGFGNDLYLTWTKNEGWKNGNQRVHNLKGEILKILKDGLDYWIKDEGNQKEFFEEMGEDWEAYCKPIIKYIQESYNYFKTATWIK